MSNLLRNNQARIDITCIFNLLQDLLGCIAPSLILLTIESIQDGLPEAAYAFFGIFRQMATVRTRQGVTPRRNWMFCGLKTIDKAHNIWRSSYSKDFTAAPGSGSRLGRVNVTAHGETPHDINDH